MNHKQDFHYNMIKGRIAEAVIKELFHSNGYRVYDYGMERTLPEAIENVRNLKDEMAYSIRHMPDFLVQHIATGKLNYVEVKYRANGSFSIKNIENNPYKNTCFIVISKENIQSILYEELENGQKLPGAEEKNVENCPLFSFEKDLVVKYKGYAKSFFEGVV